MSSKLHMYVTRKPSTPSQPLRGKHYKKTHSLNMWMKWTACLHPHNTPLHSFNILNFEEEYEFGVIFYPRPNAPFA